MSDVVRLPNDTDDREYVQKFLRSYDNSAFTPFADEFVAYNGQQLLDLTEKELADITNKGTGRRLWKVLHPEAATPGTINLHLRLFFFFET